MYSGGNATNTIINSGGIQYVSRNGSATSATINYGGKQEIWGSASGITVN
ncbi:AIDA repeat-containing protein, partial [Escherichia coli]